MTCTQSFPTIDSSTAIQERKEAEINLIRTVNNIELLFQTIQNLRLSPACARTRTHTHAHTLGYALSFSLLNLRRQNSIVYIICQVLQGWIYAWQLLQALQKHLADVELGNSSYRGCVMPTAFETILVNALTCQRLKWTDKRLLLKKNNLQDQECELRYQTCPTDMNCNKARVVRWTLSLAHKSVPPTILITLSFADLMAADNRGCQCIACDELSRFMPSMSELPDHFHAASLIFIKTMWQHTHSNLIRQVRSRLEEPFKVLQWPQFVANNCILTCDKRSCHKWSQLYYDTRSRRDWWPVDILSVLL